MIPTDFMSGCACLENIHVRRGAFCESERFIAIESVHCQLQFNHVFAPIHICEYNITYVNCSEDARFCQLSGEELCQRKCARSFILVLKKIELRSVPIPEPAPGEVLVKVRAATTCGTDVKTYRRGHPKFPPPFIFGHEFGGDIVKLGDGVEKFKEGMRVTANVFAECGGMFLLRTWDREIFVPILFTTSVLLPTI